MSTPSIVRKKRFGTLWRQTVSRLRLPKTITRTAFSSHSDFSDTLFPQNDFSNTSTKQYSCECAMMVTSRYHNHSQVFLIRKTACLGLYLGLHITNAHMTFYRPNDMIRYRKNNRFGVKMLYLSLLFSSVVVKMRKK